MSHNFLLVEDNPLNQKIVVFHLRKHHHTVTVASTGEEALVTFKNQQFDTVLMDLMLPGIDGFETTRKIREYENNNPERKKVLIIALTANTLDNDREKCLQHGMNEFISKPFDIVKLNHILNKWQLEINKIQQD